MIAIPLLRRGIGSGMGVDVPLGRFLLLTLPVPILLLALTWLPSWHGARGRMLLPVVLGLGSANLILEKYLTLLWLVAPEQRELNAVLLLLRLWLILHMVTLMVAWQYSWRHAMVVSLALSAVDSALSLPFFRPDSPLYSLYTLLLGLRTATVTVVAVGIGWLLQLQREQRAALTAANQKLSHYATTTEQLAISRERNRLARELHDTLAHSLAAVAVQLEATGALWDAGAPNARAMLESAHQNTCAGLTESRRALQALRARPLEDAGLVVAVGNLARSAAARASLRLDLQAPDEWPALLADHEQCLYRVAQEAISNVARHARATTLRVAVERPDGHPTLTIADDGQGFEPAEVDGSTHFGLRGIRERVEMIGGRLSIETSPGRGTIVRVTLPAGDGA